MARVKISGTWFDRPVSVEWVDGRIRGDREVLAEMELEAAEGTEVSLPRGGPTYDSDFSDNPWAFAALAASVLEGGSEPPRIEEEDLPDLEEGILPS